MVKAREELLLWSWYREVQKMSCKPDPVHSMILPGLPIFLKWPCVGAVAQQAQLLLAPPDGQDAPSAPFTPQLFAPQAATVSTLEVRAPVPWLWSLAQGGDPKLASSLKQLNGWTKWVIPYSKMGICIFPLGSLPLYLLFSSVFMWDVRYQGS